MLTDAPSVGRQRALEGIQQRLGALAQLRRGLGPRLAVAGEPVSPELRAERDQRREVGHGLHGAGLRDPHEPVRVEVVAEQQSGVVVAGGEQPRAPIVQQVALVDRLQPQCVALSGQRGEDRLALPFLLRPKSLGPEPALTRRLLRDRLPEIDGYSQPASSFVQ